MPRKSLKVGPLHASLAAGRDGAEVTLGLGGAAWNRWYKGLADRRRAARDVAWNAAVPRLPAEPANPEAAALAARVASVGWYQTIDLGHGVLTPGEFNHIPHLAKYRLPETLAGKRVLDIGTFDGFWAFQFEKRGAAEVMALDVETFGDIDFPPNVRAGMADDLLATPLGRGFAIAHEALGSRVQRRTGSVYRLDAAEWGRFDVSHIGNVLVHLRDPALALQRMRAVTEGVAIISEMVDPDIDGLGDAPLMRYMGGQVNCNWWRYSTASLRQLALDAGFARVEEVARFNLPLRDSARDQRQVVLLAHTA
ncbi:methyltransferase domain-containing protein [Roseomonas sp. CECT 9278]|uniref:methyltransferase domain-containing protein n=1 Tax=Roseomonas sp. CECT 9278 TaxID=2845823 RepID=UPI001E601E39|nr:methyltransferase domain-containing protein [Roseomonas sp. CECT 9278]